MFHEIGRTETLIFQWDVETCPDTFQFFKIPREVSRLFNGLNDVKKSLEWKNNSIMKGRADWWCFIFS